MNCVFLTATSLLLLVSSPCFAAEDITVDSHLKAVIVYTNRASLTRQAEVNLPAGAHTLIFKGLSASLLPDSLRAEGNSEADVKLGAVSYKIIPGDELVAPREKELTDQLEVLQDKRVLIDAEKQALAQEQAFLNTLGNNGAAHIQEKIAAVDLKPAQWTAAAQAVRSGIADVLKSQVAQDIALRNIDRQIRKVQEELGQLHTGQRNTYQVAIPVETSQAAKLTIELSYQLPDATWSPLYDARLDIDKGALELVQYGAVRQKTGEDWNGVQLTLSTAQPQRGAGLPDLQTMWVNLYQRAVMRLSARASQIPGRGDVDPAYRKAMEDANQAKPAQPMQAGVSHIDMPISIDANLPGMPQAPRSDVLEEWKRVSDAGRMKGAKEAIDEENQIVLPIKVASFNTATIETGGFVGEYKIPGPSNVKSDGTESKLMIGTFDTDSKMLVQIKPQISKEAYLIVHTKLKGESPVLAGPVSLFRDGAFMGQSRLPLLRPGQDSDLAFGIDDQVSINRHVIKDEHSEAGLITPDNVQERRFVTDLQNLHNRKVMVDVMETIPVAQDKQISAEIEPEETTAGYKEDKDNLKGLLNWEVPLEAKQKTEIKLGWKVTWPKDQSISGL